MKMNVDAIKRFIESMGYCPEDGVNNIYYKQYQEHNNYIIRVNFNTQRIEYRGKDVQAEDGIQWGDLTTSNFEKSENFAFWNVLTNC